MSYEERKYKSYEMIIKMLEYRKYNDIARLTDLSMENVIIKYNDDKYLILFFFKCNKIRTSIIRNILNVMMDTNINHVIFLYKNNITVTAKSTIDTIMVDKKYKIESFTYDETQYQLSTNIYVPKHTILSEEYAIEHVYDKYGYNKDIYPKIKETDVMVKYIGAIPGQLIEIHRMNVDSLQEEISYRIVVKWKK